MQRFLTISILAVLMLSCSQRENGTENSKLKVVVSILPYADFVKQLGGDLVEVSVMVPPGVSPVNYEPTPQQLKNFANSDIYFEVGGAFVFEKNWLNKIKSNYTDISFINTGKKIELIDENPHVWLGPAEASHIISIIADTLIKRIPTSEKIITQNKKDYLVKIEEIVTKYFDKFENSLNTTFLTYHPAWGYFANRFGLKEISIEDHGKEPHAHDLSNLIELAKENNINTIFVEPQFHEGSAEIIAGEIGAKLVELNPLPKNYIENLNDVAAKVYRSLQNK